MSFLKDLKKNADTGTVFIHNLNKFQTPKIPWKKGYRPSQISYRFCPRLWSLMALGYVKGFTKFSAQSKRVVDNGTKVHERYSYYANNLDIIYKDKRYGDEKNEYRCEERMLEHPLGIRGKYDCIIEGIDGVLYVTDFKSIKHEQFELLIQPLDYHIKQLVVYLGLVDELYDLDKPICGLYVYESKNTQEVKEFKVPWNAANKELYQQLLAFIAEAELAIERKNPDLATCLCKSKDPCKHWRLEDLERNPKRIDM